jgi:Peptidase propeptide and YPEB domain
VTSTFLPLYQSVRRQRYPNVTCQSHVKFISLNFFGTVKLTGNYPRIIYNATNASCHPIFGAFLTAAPAMADRAPTAEERVTLEQVLRASGFVSWEEIELDDDGPFWEVDDARTANPSDGKFDIKIDPNSMKIVKRRLDD